MSKPRYKSVSDYLTTTRYSQRELAAMVGVSESAISLYRKGKRIPQPAIAIKLSDLCGISLRALLSPEP